MKVIIHMAFTLLTMSLIALIPRLIDQDNLLLLDYIQSAMIIVSSSLTAALAITYGLFLSKYNFHKKNPDLAYGEDGKKLDLEEALAESKYVLLAICISGLSIIVNCIY